MTNKTCTSMAAALVSACLAFGGIAAAQPSSAIAAPEACVPKSCPTATSAPKHSKPAAHRAKPRAVAVHDAALPPQAGASMPPLSVASTPAPGGHEATRPAPESTAADPSLALRDTPPKEIVLPGVLRVDGESVTAFDPTRAHKISWGNDGTQPIPVSLNGPDHLILPFVDPDITSNEWVSIGKKATSNNVYITFQFPEGIKPQPVTIYIESPTGGPSLGLQLMPKDIPPQTYTVVDELGLGTTPGRAGGAADYETRILDLMATMAARGTPAGYSVLPMNLPPVAFHGLRLDTIRRLSNVDNDIYEYAISNITQSTVTVTEKDFAGSRVQAVSIYPKATLRSGESVRVIVVASKPEDK